jgi:O-succinylbenzoate synthase
MAATIDIDQIRAAADILVVKAIPIGGVQRALNLVTEIGLPAVVSGSLDTSVGLSSGIALAASIPQLYGACGLGTGTLFAQDLVTPTTLPTDGELTVRRSSPDAHLLANSAAKVSDSDRLWWQERIVRAWQSGANELVSPSVKEAVEQ